MSQNYKVDFATFCYSGDIHRLYAPGQLKKQVESNCYPFDKVKIIHQLCDPGKIEDSNFFIQYYKITHLDDVLRFLGIDLLKEQYTSSTDRAHHWKYHVVNHLYAADVSDSDYIVFADNDCWMVDQPENKSWINKGIEILENDPDIFENHPQIFIVSPNDGEPERRTSRFSQQMFMARTEEFRNADFNQPYWDGNVHVPEGPLPEYWAMLEGRMELHCRKTGQYRYVLGPEYRYWHHNRLTEDGLFETDRNKY